MADAGRKARERTARSTPLRAFGRALNWVGNGAKSVVSTPFRVAGWRREQQVQVQGSAAVLAEPSPPQTAAFADTLQTLGAEWRQRAQQPWQQLGSRLQRGAALLAQQQPWQELGTRVQGGAAQLARRLAPRRPVASLLAADCFPPRLVTGRAAGAGGGLLSAGEEAQDLVCTGSREMLRIRLYDFGLYVDRRQAQQSRLAKRTRAAPGGAPPPQEEELRLGAALRDSPDIDMCLVVRAARNLPVRLLAREYERILRRRLRSLGASADDPALAAMLANLREERLPAAIKQGGSVRRGSVIAFTRGKAGRLTAVAGGVDLGTVQSEALSRAIFDIYLGRQPVTVEGRRAASESFRRMLREGGFAPPPAPLVCDGAVCPVGRL